MQSVSQEWKNNQEQLLVSPAHIKIEYLAINPEITALSTDLGEVNWDSNQKSQGTGAFTSPFPEYTINFSEKVSINNSVLVLDFSSEKNNSYDATYYI